jgi:hypothetical protein
VLVALPPRRARSRYGHRSGGRAPGEFRKQEFRKSRPARFGPRKEEKPSWIKALRVPAPGRNRTSARGFRKRRVIAQKQRTKTVRRRRRGQRFSLLSVETSPTRLRARLSRNAPATSSRTLSESLQHGGRCSEPWERRRQCNVIGVRTFIQCAVSTDLDASYRCRLTRRWEPTGRG